MNTKDMPRAIITAAVMVLFAYAFVTDPDDEMMKGALIAAFSLGISYWLGSSKGSSDKSLELSRQASETQTVQIDQPVDEPVPVQPQ